MRSFITLATTAVVSFAATALLSPVAQARDATTAQDKAARELYRTIISFETAEGNGKVPEMARYLAGKFREAGFPESDIVITPVGETATLTVRYRSDGSGGKPILLMAHMDVVPAKREDWVRNPYELTQEGNFFYGRGTSDNKAGVAQLSATFLRLKAEKFVPQRDLIIFFSGDEETSAVSVQEVLKNHRNLVDAEYALNSDGGGGEFNEETGKAAMFLVQGAEKTYATFDLTVRNAGGHSSRPRPDNAIYELADALKRVQAYQFPVMTNEWTLANLKESAKTATGPVGDALRAFVANPKDGPAADLLAKQSEYVGITRTTCVATMLRGGHAENALPQSATATVNCRVFPGMSIETVQAALQKAAGEKTEVKVTGEPSATDASPLRKDVMDAVGRVIHKRFPGLPIVGYMSAGATDGKFFRGAGIPVYGVGFLFSKSSEEFAHGLNERIRVDEFYQGLDDWAALLRDIAGKKK